MDISFGTIVTIVLCSVIGINLSNAFVKYLIKTHLLSEINAHIFTAFIVFVILWALYF